MSESESPQSESNTTIARVESFQALELPDDAVVIIDRALPQAWIDTFDAPIVVDAGESLKRLASIEALAGQVLERRSTRPLTIVGIGGGSIGDAVGFLASTLWRGVDLWHVPTTLLAMVDSAHGGKTAVNLGEAKNQLGTFYLAKKVVLVDQALATLPLEHRRDGLAELVKGLWLGDEDALDLLETDGGVDQLAAAPFDEISERMMALLERAIDVKLDIVDQDLFETKGIRTFLNLGHTVAHTLELHTGVSHGQAVCWGLLSASFWCDLPRLRRHVYALLTPSQPVVSFADRELFCAGIKRDKKRIDGQLRSVLLHGPAEPYVTRKVSAGDWFGAFREAVEWFETTPAKIERGRVRGATLDVAASKSEMNRALVIAHLRPGRPGVGSADGAASIDGHSQADDVAWLKSCLETLAATDGPAQIYAGEGGTTFRFLLAVCAARPDETLLLAAPRLLDRPHDALIDALTDAGATIELVESTDGCGYRVVGFCAHNTTLAHNKSWPERFEVSAALSSQYATALALLAASGHPFELELSDAGEVASRPYFDMTLELLRSAGVEVAEQGNTLSFSPTPALREETTLTAETDASSAAVWAFARLVGVDATVTKPPTSGRQPDARAAVIAQELADAHAHGTDQVEVDLSQSPDLAPVLAAVATQIDPAVDIVGAAHLRHKESDRIGDLAEALAQVGVTIEPREAGMHIPAGVQTPRDGASWPTFGDHRLAMAGLLLTASGVSLHIEAPMVVAKSYPAFWHHARQLGWVIGVES
jgi:3-phosphoshikimate 1-carboxyvinyltransferase